MLLLVHLTIVLTTINCTFIENNAKEDGGAIYFDCGYLDNYVINSTFINNSANRGGAIYDAGYIINTVHNIFDGNIASLGRDI